jgi:alkylation response protein AidB-like acyl-CoA dehydrogenase
MSGELAEAPFGGSELATTLVEPSTTKAPYRPRPVFPDDEAFVPLAAELGAEFAPRAADLDRDREFATANFERLRASGFSALAVPVELGGLGASIRQVCYAQAELAKHCASSALAINMHIYLTLVQAFRYRNGLPGADKVLQRVANEGLILMTSGGSDGLWPSGTAEPVEGGYRVNGRKIFCSQAPVANGLSTMAVNTQPENGDPVLVLSIPTTSEGVEIVDTWDTLGMRATASHDVQLNNVFVSDAQVAGKRPWGKLDPVLCSAGFHFAPIVSAVYYGIAAAARDEAVRSVSSRKMGDGKAAADPVLQRLIGLMDCKLNVAWWSLIGSVNELPEDYKVDDETLARLMAAKRQVLLDAQDVVDLAMSAIGGLAYYKRSPVERAYRDVRAGAFHPMTPEKTLYFAGRLALGQPADTIW